MVHCVRSSVHPSFRLNGLSQSVLLSTNTTTGDQPRRTRSNDDSKFITSFHLAAFSYGSTVVFVPHPKPVARRQNAHDFVASGLTAQSAVIHASPQPIATLEEERVVSLPFLAQTPREQFELELFHVVFHVERQVKSDEKVFRGIFGDGEFGTDKVDEHHRKNVSEGGND